MRKKQKNLVSIFEILLEQLWKEWNSCEIHDDNFEALLTPFAKKQRNVQLFGVYSYQNFVFPLIKFYIFPLSEDEL